MVVRFTFLLKVHTQKCELDAKRGVVSEENNTIRKNPPAQPYALYLDNRKDDLRASQGLATHYPSQGQRCKSKHFI